jgi:hypothetical protein
MSSSSAISTLTTDVAAAPSESAAVVATPAAAAITIAIPVAATPVFLKGTAATCTRCGVVGHRTDRCVFHLLPDVVVALPTSKKHRLEQLCNRWRREADEHEQEDGNDQNGTSPAETAPPAAAAVAVASAEAIDVDAPMDWHVGSGLEVLPSPKGQIAKQWRMSTRVLFSNSCVIIPTHPFAPFLSCFRFRRARIAIPAYTNSISTHSDISTFAAPESPFRFDLHDKTQGIDSAGSH